MDLNLDTLKREILEYLEAGGFAVFRGTPGGLEGLPMVLWDTERLSRLPDVSGRGRKTGAKMIIFATREFEATEIDERLEELEECELTREERREWKADCATCARYEGVTCSLELAFDHHAAHVRLRSAARLVRGVPEHRRRNRRAPADATNDDDDGSLGGYFSNN